MRSLLLLSALAPIALASAQARPLSPPHEVAAERTETICKLTAQGQGRTGKALNRAVQRCVGEVSPSLAYWEHCRQSARHEHLKGLALRDDVAACMARTS